MFRNLPARFARSLPRLDAPPAREFLLFLRDVKQGLFQTSQQNSLLSGFHSHCLSSCSLHFFLMSRIFA